MKKHLWEIFGYSILLILVVIAGNAIYSLNAFGIKGKMTERKIEATYTTHKAEIYELDSLCHHLCGKYDLDKLVAMEYGDFTSIKLRFKLKEKGGKHDFEYYYTVPGYKIEEWRCVDVLREGLSVHRALLQDPALFHLFSLFIKLRCDFSVTSNNTGTFIGLFDAITRNNSHYRSGLFLPVPAYSNEAEDNNYIKKIDTRVYIEDTNYRLAER